MIEIQIYVLEELLKLIFNNYFLYKSHFKTF